MRPILALTIRRRPQKTIEKMTMPARFRLGRARFNDTITKKMTTSRLDGSPTHLAAGVIGGGAEDITSSRPHHE